MNVIGHASKYCGIFLHNMWYVNSANSRGTRKCPGKFVLFSELVCFFVVWIPKKWLVFVLLNSFALWSSVVWTSEMRGVHRIPADVKPFRNCKHAWKIRVHGRTLRTMHRQEVWYIVTTPYLHHGRCLCISQVGAVWWKESSGFLRRGLQELRRRILVFSHRDLTK